MVPPKHLGSTMPLLGIRWGAEDPCNLLPKWCYRRMRRKSWCSGWLSCRIEALVGPKTTSKIWWRPSLMLWGAKTIFKDNRPGKDWMQAFFKRHPQVAERMGQALGRERAVMTKDPWLKGSSKWNNTWTAWTLLCSRLLAKFLMLMKVASASVQRKKNQQDRSQACLLHQKQHTAAGDNVGLFLCCRAVYSTIATTADLHLHQGPSLQCAGGVWRRPLPPPPKPLPPPKKNNQTQWMDYWGGLSQLPERRLHSHLGEKRPVVLFVDGHSSHHSLAIIILFISNAVFIVVNKT